MVVLNSRDRQGKLWLPDFCTSNNQAFAENTYFNALILL